MKWLGSECYHIGLRSLTGVLQDLRFPLVSDPWLHHQSLASFSFCLNHSIPRSIWQLISVPVWSVLVPAKRTNGIEEDRDRDEGKKAKLDLLASSAVASPTHQVAASAIAPVEASVVTVWLRLGIAIMCFPGTIFEPPWIYYHSNSFRFHFDMQKSPLYSYTCVVRKWAETRRSWKRCIIICSVVSVCKALLHT